MRSRSSAFLKNWLLNKRYRIRDTKYGFTLLEVLIATIIFTVGVVTIIWMFNAGLYASTDVENIDLALNIAQGKMEEIKGAGYVSLTASGPETDPVFSNFDLTVSLGPVADPRQVVVTVKWKALSGVKKGQIPNVSVALTTLIADY